MLDFPHCVVHEMPELTAESLVSWKTELISAGFTRFLLTVLLTPRCVFSGSRRQQPVLLEEPVLLHQPAADTEQADQVETLPDDGEIRARRSYCSYRFIFVV